MSDLLRMTGMYSGMDTESIVQQLVQTKSTKVTNLKNCLLYTSPSPRDCS